MKIKILSNNVNSFKRATPGSAGFDLYPVESGVISPGDSIKIKTGVALSLDINTVGLLCSRSGIGSKGINVINRPGIIDSDYRGEILIALHNESPYYYEYSPNEAVAQLIIVPTYAGSFEFVDELDSTYRGCNGFGSTS